MDQFLKLSGNNDLALVGVTDSMQRITVHGICKSSHYEYVSIQRSAHTYSSAEIRRLVSVDISFTCSYGKDFNGRQISTIAMF